MPAPGFTTNEFPASEIQKLVDEALGFKKQNSSKRKTTKPNKQPAKQPAKSLLKKVVRNLLKNLLKKLLREVEQRKLWE